MSTLRVKEIKSINADPLVIGSNIIISGSLVANNVVTLSGSTFTGNSKDTIIDDLWVNNEIAGQITVTNIVSPISPFFINDILEVNGSVQADYFYGDGSNLTNLNLPKSPLISSIGKNSIVQNVNQEGRGLINNTQSFGDNSFSFGNYNTANGDSSFVSGSLNRVGGNHFEYFVTDDSKYLVVFNNAKSEFVTGNTTQLLTTSGITIGSTTTTGITVTTISQIITGNTSNCNRYAMYIPYWSGVTAGTFSYVDCLSGNRITGNLNINNPDSVACTTVIPKVSQGVIVNQQGSCCNLIEIITSTTVTTVTTTVTGITFNNPTGECLQYYVTNMTGGMLWGVDYIDCDNNPVYDKFYSAKTICSRTYPNFRFPQNWTGGTPPMLITPLGTTCCTKYLMIPNFMGHYYIEHEPCCGQQTLITGYSNYSPFYICSQSTPLVTNINAPNYINPRIDITATTDNCSECLLSAVTISSTSVSYTSVTITSGCTFSYSRLSQQPPATCYGWTVSLSGDNYTTATIRYLDCRTGQLSTVDMCNGDSIGLCVLDSPIQSNWPTIISTDWTGSGIINIISDIVQSGRCSCDCFDFDLVIDQRDLNAASGNTGQYSVYNNKVTLGYLPCDGDQQTLEYVSYDTAGTYKICMSLFDIVNVGISNFQSRDYWWLYYFHDTVSGITYNNKEFTSGIGSCFYSASTNTLYSTINNSPILFSAQTWQCCGTSCKSYKITIGNRPIPTGTTGSDYILYSDCNDYARTFYVPLEYNNTNFYICSLFEPTYIGPNNNLNHVTITEIGNCNKNDCTQYEFTYNPVRGGLCIWVDCSNNTQTTTITPGQSLKVCAIRNKIGGKANIRKVTFSPGCPQLIGTGQTLSYKVIESFDGEEYVVENYVDSNAKIYNGSTTYPIQINEITEGITNENGEIIITLKDEPIVLLDGLNPDLSYTLFKLENGVPSGFEYGLVASNYFGKNSTSVGSNNLSKGISSVSEGINTKSIGTASHVGGIEAVAIHTAEFARSGSGNNGSNQYSFIHVLGSTSDTNKIYSSYLYVNGANEHIKIPNNSVVNLTLNINVVSTYTTNPSLTTGLTASFYNQTLVVKNKDGELSFPNLNGQYLDSSYYDQFMHQFRIYPKKGTTLDGYIELWLEIKDDNSTALDATWGGLITMVQNKF